MGTGEKIQSLGWPPEVVVGGGGGGEARKGAVIFNLADLNTLSPVTLKR